MNELKELARLLCGNYGANFGLNKINRLVTQFVAAMPNASGHTFFLYIANAIQMSADQQREALRDAANARVVGYADPTGETAVNSVRKLRMHRRGERIVYSDGDK